MKIGDLIKFKDHRYSSRLNVDEEMFGMIIDMKVRMWGEVANVTIVSGGKTFEIFEAQILEAFSAD